MGWRAGDVLCMLTRLGRFHDELHFDSMLSSSSVQAGSGCVFVRRRFSFSLISQTLKATIGGARLFYLDLARLRLDTRPYLLVGGYRF